jgi:hypothetical protein
LSIAVPNKDCILCLESALVWDRVVIMQTYFSIVLSNTGCCICWSSNNSLSILLLGSVLLTISAHLWSFKWNLYCKTTYFANLSVWRIPKTDYSVKLCGCWFLLSYNGCLTLRKIKT